MTTRTHPLQEAFNAGEFGKRMLSRVLFEKYQNAGAIYENILPLPQGGFTRRPGFRYIAAVQSASKRSWLLPFEYSTTQAYVLEFGDNILRFFKNQAQISAADLTSAAITNGDFPSNINDWDDRSTGVGAISHDAGNGRLTLTPGGATAADIASAEQDVSTGSTGTAHIVRFQVIGDPGDKVRVQCGSTSTGAELLAEATKEVGWHTVEFTPAASPFYLQFRALGTDQNKAVQIDNVSILDDTPVQLTTPWAEADLPNLSYAQSANDLYICIGGSTRVYRLDRYGHQSWSLVNVLFQDGPYLPKNTTATTLLLSAVSGYGINVTASAITGINNDQGFRATDVGRLIRWKDSGNKWTWLQITAITSTTIVVADVLGPNAAATTATADWRLGEWNDTDGWPSVVGFIQQRLGLAGTDTDPQKFWLSKSADVENFADQDVDGAAQADSSIPYRFAAKKVNAIRWLAVRKRPVVGTVGGEWVLRSSGASLAPDDISADLETSSGSKKLPPVEARSRLIFIQAAGRKFQEFSDSLRNTGETGFDSFDLTVLNDRVLTSGAIQLDYAKEPDSILWTVRTDGQAPTLTYQPDQSVIGWSRQIIGGAFQGGDAVVESVAVIPGTNGTGQFKDSTGRDEVWVEVKRTVNSATVRYIECLEKSYSGDEDDQQDAFYVDSGLTLDVPITITGITAANPAVVTVADASTLANADAVRIVGVKGFETPLLDLNGNTVVDFEGNTVYISGVNEKSFKLANKTGSTFELTDLDDVDLDASAFTAYGSGGKMREKVSTVSGLDHLEGETVKVFADGGVQTDKTVASGAITIDSPAGMVHVGLRYVSTWKSLKLAYGARAGSAVGKPKNLSDATLVLLETAEGAFKIASIVDETPGTFTELDLRQVDDESQEPPPFFTGETGSLGIEGSYDGDTRLIIQGAEPAPFTILGISPDLELNEQV